MATTATKPLIAIIAVNGIRFARNASIMVDSLFNAGGTASGLFKARKHSVLFMRADGTPFACLVANPHQSPFFVSAFKQSDGRTRYSFGLSDSDARALGISSLTYSQQSDEALRVWNIFQ